jgi:hypothetical protein
MMNSNSSPKAALDLIAGRGKQGAMAPGGDIVRRQWEEVDRKSDPSMVVQPKNSWNPFSLNARMRKAADEAALSTRLAVFKDQLLGLRKTNEVLIRAAIADVAIASEDYLTRVMQESNHTKYRSRHEVSIKLKQVFTAKLVDLQNEIQHKTINSDMLERMLNAAYLEFAEESAKLAGINVEFDKTSLLLVTFDPAQ